MKYDIQDLGVTKINNKIINTKDKGKIVNGIDNKDS